MKVTRRQLRRIIKEAQWGNFTVGAAPLDEPPMDSGPMTPEMQQRVFDILVDSGSDPQELKASGEYPDLMLDADDGPESDTKWGEGGWGSEASELGYSHGLNGMAFEDEHEGDADYEAGYEKGYDEYRAEYAKSMLPGAGWSSSNKFDG